MKTWIFNHKKISTLAVLILSFVWFFGYYMPKQACLQNISIDRGDYAIDHGVEGFKTRNDALDYCMAQRWDF